MKQTYPTYHEAKIAQQRSRQAVAVRIVIPLLILVTALISGLSYTITGLNPVSASEKPKQVKVPADKENCLECHTAKKKIQLTAVGREKPSTYLDPNLVLATAHAKLACTDCHKGYTRAIERKSLSRFGKSEVRVLHSEQEYRNYTQVATEACGDKNCHEKEQKDFLAGSHSQNIAKTDKDLPTCTTCHNFHYIPRLFREKNGKPKKLSAQLKIDVAVSLCGSCHVDALNTYTGNYHYKALRLGNADAPMCYDCHSGHKSEPLRPGTKESIANCKKCHKKANKAFTYYVVHLNPTAITAPPEVLYSNLFYTALIIVVVSMVSLHTTIQWTRKRKERRLKEKQEYEKWLKEQEEASETDGTE